MNDNEDLGWSEDEKKITSEQMAEKEEGKEEEKEDEKEKGSEGLAEEEEGKEEEEEVAKPIVIVIDDDKKVRKLVKKALKKEYDVVDLEEGKGFMKVLKEERPALLLLDEELPDAKGWRIIQDIIEESRYKDMALAEIPIVMLSDTLPGPKMTLRKELERLCDFILKPFSKEEISTRVDKIFKRLSKIEEIGSKAKKRSFQVGDEYERISKALYLRRALVKPLKEELKKKREDGSMEEIQALEKAVAGYNAYINFYFKRKKEIEALTKKWEEPKIG